MKIRKIAKKIINLDDAIIHIFGGCEGEALIKLIPAEYNGLLARYEEIREKSKTKDLPGQQTLFGDEEFHNITPQKSVLQ